METTHDLTCPVTHPTLGRCLEPAGHDASSAAQPHRYTLTPAITPATPPCIRTEGAGAAAHGGWCVTHDDGFIPGADYCLGYSCPECGHRDHGYPRPCSSIVDNGWNWHGCHCGGVR